MMTCIVTIIEICVEKAGRAIFGIRASLHHRDDNLRLSSATALSHLLLHRWCLSHVGDLTVNVPSHLVAHVHSHVNRWIKRVPTRSRLKMATGLRFIFFLANDYAGSGQRLSLSPVLKATRFHASLFPPRSMGGTVSLHVSSLGSFGVVIV